MIRDVLRYLIKHPAAKDTVQGILRWWLPPSSTQLEEDDLQDVLEGLVTRGWMTKRRMASGQTLYGLNPDQINSVRAFLDEGENSFGADTQ